jgi:hypothetical protein
MPYYMKAIKYIKIAIFTLATLGIFDFILSSQSTSSPGRYHFSDFDDTGYLRSWIDVILLTSLIIFTIYQWKPKKRTSVYWTVSFTYMLFISMDLGVWGWHLSESSLYFIILSVQSLPIMILLSEMSQRVPLKYIFITGVVFLTGGFVFENLFGVRNFFTDGISPEMTEKMIYKLIRDQKILFGFYYLAIVISISGLLNFFNFNKAPTKELV